MIDRRTFMLILTPAIVAPRLAFAQTAGGEAGAFVATFAQKVIVDVLSAPLPVYEKQDRFRTMCKQYFDLPTITRFVLGRYARTVPPQAQSTFATLFEDLIVFTWARRFSEYNGQTLKVTGSSPDGDDGAIVKSNLVTKTNETFAVDWRVRRRQDGHKVVDVIVAGVSMAITYQQEYTSLIAQSGVDGLIAQLQKQVAALRPAT